MSNVCADAEVMTKDLTLDMDIGQYNEAATKQQLAALYGVDSSLITLTVVGGSVQLTVTIATTNGGSNSVLAALSAVNDAALAAALGVPVTSMAPQLSCPPGSVQSVGADGVPFCLTANLLDEGMAATCPPGKQELGTSCFPCPRGHYCAGGVAILCPIDKWLNTTGATNQSSCIRTPAGTMSVQGFQLVVKTGYYLNDPYSGRAAYKCATNYARACLGGGDEYGEASCAQGHTGLLCGRCINGYYRGRRSCLSCEALDTGDSSASADTAILISVLSVSLPLLVSLYLKPPSLPSALCVCCLAVTRTSFFAKISRRLPQILAIAGGLAKIMLQYCQCMSAIQRFPLIVWPNLFYRFMELLDEVNIELFSTIPAECIAGGRLGFYLEMLATLLIPIFSATGVVLLVILLTWLERARMKRSKSDKKKDGWRFWDTVRYECNQPKIWKMMIW